MLHKKLLISLGFMAILTSCSTETEAVAPHTNFSNVEESSHNFDRDYMIIKDNRTGCEYLKSYGGDSSFVYVKGSCPAITN